MFSPFQKFRYNQESEKKYFRIFQCLSGWTKFMKSVLNLDRVFR